MRRGWAAWALCALLAARAPAGEPLRIAAAANLGRVMPALDDAFRAGGAPGEVTVTLGSSGSLVAQIENGAPFDVFLSADMDFPRALARAGRAEGATLRPFALGRLVLWTTRPERLPHGLGQALRQPWIRRLSIASPSTAPFGRAAREALQRLGLWASLQPRIVTAEDISQAAQFVDTGNADAGLISLSTVLAPAMKGRGSWQPVDPALYTPIVEGAILTRSGAPRPEARAYLQFLGGPAAGQVLKRAGYGLPAGRL
ncbi:MAG TPA: molybdate ABC transporter substrate-binding protein [Opitutaceae bacterium]